MLSCFKRWLILTRYHTSQACSQLFRPDHHPSWNETSRTSSTSIILIAVIILCIAEWIKGGDAIDRQAGQEDGAGSVEDRSRQGQDRPGTSSKDFEGCSTAAPRRSQEDHKVKARSIALWEFTSSFRRGDGQDAISMSKLS